MSNQNKRKFEEFTDSYFTLIWANTRNENNDFVPDDFTVGRVFQTLPPKSPYKVVTRDGLEAHLRNELYDPENLDDDDDYGRKLCKINLLSEITELETCSTVTKFELLESYNLDIQTMVDLGINEITMLFNILAYAASTNRFRDFQIWLDADASFELHPRSLNKVGFGNKQHLINTIRMVLMLAINRSSLEVLECLCSCPIIYEHFGKNVVYYASVLGCVKVLDWLYRFAKQNGLEFKYEYDCIDDCCKRGHPQVLEWFITKAVVDKDFELLYTQNAMDTATLYGNTKILQCWHHNKETLESLGYELLYTEEGFNLANADEQSPFETCDVQDRYGSFIFNRYQDMCDEPLDERANGDYFTWDYCSDVLKFSIEWWSKSGLPLKCSLNALKEATFTGSISLLDTLVSAPGFNLRETFSALPENEFQLYSIGVMNEIKKKICSDYQDAVLFWWLKFVDSAARLANINCDNITSLINQYKIRLENGEQFKQAEEVNIDGYEVGATAYNVDDERLDLDKFWKNFNKIYTDEDEDDEED